MAMASSSSSFYLPNLTLTLPFRHPNPSLPHFPHSPLLSFFNLSSSSLSLCNRHHNHHNNNIINKSSKSLTISCACAPSPSPPHNKIATLARNLAAAVLLGSLFFNFKSRPLLAQPLHHQTAQKFDSQIPQQEQKQDDDDPEETMSEKLLEQNPIDVDALKTAVNLKIKKGKTKDALQYVDKLIQLQPTEMEWRLLQALCYEMTGDFRTAKRLFQDILNHNPLLLRALHGLAMTMHKNHEGPAIFVMLEKALNLARRQNRVNEERNIRILMAQMHIIKGELEVALDKFQALIDENSRDFRPYLCQGIVYSLLGRKEEADERFEVYRQLVPGEFPQRGFLDDVVIAARAESRQQLHKELQT